MTRKITVLILTNSAFSDEKTYSSPKQLLLYIQCINNCCALPCSTWAKSSSLQIIATTTHMKKKEQHFFSTSQAAQDKKQAERLIAFSLKIGLSKTANKQMLFRPVVVYINKHGKKIDSFVKHKRAGRSALSSLHLDYTGILTALHPNFSYGLLKLRLLIREPSFCQLKRVLISFFFI